MRTAVVVCNGELPSAALLLQETRQAPFSVAADGGVKAFLRDGLVPDAVIGDLDSLPSHLPDSWNLLHDPDQETNDLEKALELCSREHVQRVVVLGAVGLRTDQTLKNLSVLVQFSPRFQQLQFRDERFDIQLIPKNFRLTGCVPGKVVSLFPISGKVEGITLTGLKYPLHGESLENGVRDGSSNETTGSEVQISYTSGALIGFFER